MNSSTRMRHQYQPNLATASSFYYYSQEWRRKVHKRTKQSPLAQENNNNPARPADFATSGMNFIQFKHNQIEILKIITRNKQINA